MSRNWKKRFSSFHSYYFKSSHMFRNFLNFVQYVKLLIKNRVCIYSQHRSFLGILNWFALYVWVHFWAPVVSRPSSRGLCEESFHTSMNGNNFYSHFLTVCQVKHASLMLPCHTVVFSPLCLLWNFRAVVWDLGSWREPAPTRCRYLDPVN